jgi:hypothetical protein
MTFGRGEKYTPRRARKKRRPSQPTKVNLPPGNQFRRNPAIDSSICKERHEGKYLEKGGGGAGMLRSSASAARHQMESEWCAQSIRGRSGARQLRKAKNRPVGVRMRKTPGMRLRPRVAAQRTLV